MLVVAGVHGNEVSGSLAAIDILRSQRGCNDQVALYVLAPANPVGLKQGSRYNAMGCDINRDFSAYKTFEARAIRTAIADLRPTAVLALHEGPQDGFFAIGTQIASAATLDAIATSVRAKGYALATEDNLGLALETPGRILEGAFTTRAKGWLGIYSLGEHATTLNVPLITTEAPWRLPSTTDRIAMQALATKTIVASLASADSPASPEH